MWVLTAGQYAASITAILVLFGIFVKWAILKPIKIYIDNATYPIHPEANGGKSLPDVIAGIERIELKVNEIDERLTIFEQKKRFKA